MMTTEALAAATANKPLSHPTRPRRRSDHLQIRQFYNQASHPEIISSPSARQCSPYIKNPPRSKNSGKITRNQLPFAQNKERRRKERNFRNRIHRRNTHQRHLRKETNPHQADRQKHRNSSPAQHHPRRSYHK